MRAGAAQAAPAGGMRKSSGPRVPGRCRGMRWRCVVREAAGTSPSLHRPGRQEVIAGRSRCRPPSLLEGARLQLTQSPFNAASRFFQRIAGFQ